MPFSTTPSIFALQSLLATPFYKQLFLTMLCNIPQSDQCSRWRQRNIYNSIPPSMTNQYDVEKAVQASRNDHRDNMLMNISCRPTCWLIELKSHAQFPKRLLKSDLGWKSKLGKFLSSARALCAHLLFLLSSLSFTEPPFATSPLSPVRDSLDSHLARRQGLVFSYDTGVISKVGA